VLALAGGLRDVKVVTNTAITLDGKIASARFDHIAIGSVTDRRYMSVLRARADAVLVGGRTFRNWPLPLVPDPAAIEALRASGFPDTDTPPLEGRRWWNVVLTHGDVPRTGRFYEDPRVRPLFFSPVADLPGEVEVGEVSVARVVERLDARGVETLLVEAGGSLIFDFLATGLVDELYVTVCPKLLGGREAPTLVDGAGFAGDAAVRLELLSCFPVGGELFLRYGVRR
jgi:riboflavin biosynthesis pyrimidine reductase